MKEILIILVSLATISCSSFLDEEVFTTVPSDEFYKTEAEVEAGLISAYSAFQSASYYDNMIFQLTDASTEMMDSRWTNNVYDNYITDAGDSQYKAFWTGSWAANSAISYVTTFAYKANLEEEVYNRIMGEARFLRALNYFNLVRIYGGVPLVLEAIVSVEDNLFPKTVSRDLVYALIVDDLLFAEKNLPVASIGRATEGAAKALLGKVYLTMAGYSKSYTNSDAIEKGDPRYYTLAYDKLGEVINGGYGYELFDNYDDVFSSATENGKEHIFSIQFKQGALGGADGGEGSVKQANFAPQNFGIVQTAYGTYRSKAAFYSRFSADDQRKAVTFLDKFTDENGTKREYQADGTGNLEYPYIRKYVRALRSENSDNFPTTSARDGEENTIILRYADVLMMYAEAAYFGGGDIVNGVAALNKVRKRANPAATSLTGSEGNFVDLLLDERELELCFEGHAWFDYVRLGKLNERSAAAGTSVKFYYWPIPGLEITKNSNLEQSLGW